MLRIHEWLDRNGQPPGVIVPIVVYHGEHVWDEPTSLRDKVQAEDDLLDFVPDMRVILVDLNLLKSAFLPDFPELEARVRALQQVLNQPTMTPRELASKSLTELQAQAAELASLLNLDPQ